MDIEKLIEQLKDLEACAFGYQINGEVLGMDCSDFEQVMVDAADALEELQAENEKLRAELEQAKAERDAAISDLETIMAYGGGNLDTCQYCKNGQCYARGGTKLCLPQWRGQKKN